MAGQDISKRLLPGQSQPVQVGGDFIFMKFADRPITVLINGGESSGSRVVMEAGDKYRPGNFQSFEVENTDPERPAQILLTVGRGDYNRQIVKGEISVSPGVRKSDGTFVDDNRFEISAFIQPRKNGTVSKENGDILAAAEPPATGAELEKITLTEDGTAQVTYSGGNSYYSDFFTVTFDRNLNVLGVITYDPDDFGWGSNANIQYYKGKIYKCTDTAIYRDGEQIATFAVAIAGNTYCIANDLIYAFPKTKTAARWVVVHNLAGELVKTYPQPAGAPVITGQLTYSPADKKWTATESSQVGFTILTEDFQVIERINGQPGYGITSSNGVSVAVGDVVYGWGVSEEPLVKIQRIPKTTPITAATWKAGCQNEGVRRDLGTLTTTADIETSYEGGQTRVSGELIKTFLELYHGAELKPEFEYLDHVYGITITQPATGELETKRISNYTTFAAAKIEDNFSAVFPSEIRLTIDSGIEFRNPMEY